VAVWPKQTLGTRPKQSKVETHSITKLRQINKFDNAAMQASLASKSENHYSDILTTMKPPNNHVAWKTQQQTKFWDSILLRNVLFQPRGKYSLCTSTAVSGMMQAKPNKWADITSSSLDVNAVVGGALVHVYINRRSQCFIKKLDGPLAVPQYR